MISILTILLFFVYIFGLGYTATYFVKKTENLFESFFLNLGLGLGIFPILAILLNFLSIPLDWKIFLAISLAFPAYVIIKKVISKQKFSLNQFRSNLKLTKSNLALMVVFLMFLFSLYMYTTGAFSYP